MAKKFLFKLLIEFPLFEALALSFSSDLAFRHTAQYNSYLQRK